MIKHPLKTKKYMTTFEGNEKILVEIPIRWLWGRAEALEKAQLLHPALGKIVSIKRVK